SGSADCRSSYLDTTPGISIVRNGVGTAVLFRHGPVRRIVLADSSAFSRVAVNTIASPDYEGVKPAKELSGDKYILYGKSPLLQITSSELTHKRHKIFLFLS